MREKLNYDLLELPVCKKCGATVPPGKTLCWCCEHTPKLHRPEEQSCDSKDACELDLEVAK